MTPTTTWMSSSFIMSGWWKLFRRTWFTSESIRPSSWFRIAFFNCMQLMTLVCNDGLEEIGEAALGGCKLQQCTIEPPAIEVIKNGTFLVIDCWVDNCASQCWAGGDWDKGIWIYTSLQHIVTPPPVKAIKKRSFYRCLGIVTVEVGAWAFRSCELLQHVIIPPIVKVIKRGTFIDCFWLMTVNLSNRLEEIGMEAF